MAINPEIQKRWINRVKENRKARQEEFRMLLTELLSELSMVRERIELAKKNEASRLRIRHEAAWWKGAYEMAIQVELAAHRCGLQFEAPPQRRTGVPVIADVNALTRWAFQMDEIPLPAWNSSKLLSKSSPPSPNLVSVPRVIIGSKNAAKIVDCSLSTLKRLVSAGTVGVFKYGAAKLGRDLRGNRFFQMPGPRLATPAEVKRHMPPGSTLVTVARLRPRPK